MMPNNYMDNYTSIVQLMLYTTQLFLKCGMYECRATKFFDSSIVSNVSFFTLEDRSSILLKALTKATGKT